MGWHDEGWSSVPWPHEDNGPLQIDVTWRRMDDQWECVGLTIGFAPGARVRPLLTGDLRGITMGALLERAGRGLAEDLLVTYRDPHDEGPHGTFVDSLIDAAPKYSGSRPLEEAARIYREAYGKGEPPRKAVADAYGLKPGTAAKWIADCRRLGLLGKTKQGRAGGVLPPEEESP